MEINIILDSIYIFLIPILETWARTQDLSSGWTSFRANVLYVAHCSPNSRTITNVSICKVLFYSLSSFVVQCCPDSKTIYYNGSLCTVLYYSLKSKELSLVLCSLYSALIIYYCNLPLTFKGVAGRHAKQLHNAYSYNCLSIKKGGGHFR